MSDPEHEVFRALIRSLEDPEEKWSPSECTWDNHSRGLRVWTSNIPVLNINLYQPAPLRLSLVQKWRLHKAVAVSRSHEIRRRLNRGRS